jgi:hypothetical protein
VTVELSKLAPTVVNVLNAAARPFILLRHCDDPAGRDLERRRLDHRFRRAAAVPTVLAGRLTRSRAEMRSVPLPALHLLDPRDAGFVTDLVDASGVDRAPGGPRPTGGFLTSEEGARTS